MEEIVLKNHLKTWYYFLDNTDDDLLLDKCNCVLRENQDSGDYSEFSCLWADGFIHFGGD